MIWVAKKLYFFNCLLDGAHTTFSRAYETAALIFRAAVSLHLHKPMMNFPEILWLIAI